MLTTEDVLNLFPGYFVHVDLKNRMILSYRINGYVIGKNLSFDQLKEILSKEQIMLDKNVSLEDVLFFMENDDIVGNFVLPLKMKDKKKHSFRISKTVNKEDREALIYVEILSEEDSLKNLTDPLTKVYQKATFEEIVVNEIKSKTHKEFSIIMLDIDEFKQFNDNFGHQFGDIILEEVAKVLKKNFTNGFIGRVGGDEFAICDFDSITLSATEKKMKRLLKDISKISTKYKVLRDAGNILSITCGVSHYPTDSKSFSKLVSYADMALYSGKKINKNCYVVYK